MRSPVPVLMTTATTLGHTIGVGPHLQNDSCVGRAKPSESAEVGETSMY